MTLAETIARKIFECGDEPLFPDGKVQRLQFMGGTWPNHERSLGGLSEQALTLLIERVLAVEIDQTPPLPLPAPGRHSKP